MRLLICFRLGLLYCLLKVKFAKFVPIITRHRQANNLTQIFGRTLYSMTEKKRSIRKWRLIVRNVSFQCKEEDIRNAFKEFGEIHEIDMPQKKGGFAGFCFVQFTTYDDAASAMKKLNGQPIKGRIVAVDWAVPKDMYMTAVIEEKERNKASQLSAKNNNNSANLKKEESENEDTAQNSSSEEENTDEDSSDESSDEKEKCDTINSDPQTSKAAAKPSDVCEGKTLFIRGLPFDVNDEELRQTFEKFGSLDYAVICKFHDSDMSKGSGFVKFTDKSSVDKCFTCQNAGDGIVLKGRKLNACLAVDRKDVAKIVADKKKDDDEPKDKRNLHLLRVGLIRAGSRDVDNMSRQDAAVRLRIEAANRLKIKNLNIFVSPTRLIVHNIPAKVDDKQLRVICLKAVGDSGAYIKECRIMRDRERVSKEGIAKSRGFAFVEFSQHGHALECLKKLNNNPEIFTDEKRPIVEFSLENRLALNAKAVRLEKAKLGLQKKLNSSNADSTVRPTLDTKKKRKLIFKPPVVGPADPKGPRKPFPSHIGPKIRTNKKRKFGLKAKRSAEKMKSKSSMAHKKRKIS